MECSNCEEVKGESAREGMREMPKSSFDHESHFIDEFVDLDELLRETLPQLGEAVKLIEQQNEADQISSEEGQKKKRMEKENRKEKIQKGADQILSEEAQESQKKRRMEKENRKKKIQKEADQIPSDEAQESQKKKRMEKENRKKKIQKGADQISSDEAQEGQKPKRMEKENSRKKRKKRVCSPSLSQGNVIEGDSKKEHRCEIIGVSVSVAEQPSTPHHTEASPVEAQVRKNKHAKKKRKMGTEDLHILSPPQRKRSEPGSVLLSRENSNEVLVGDDSQTTMPNGNQSKVLTPKEIWELRYQYLAMEVCLQMLTFIKDVCIDTLHSLKETIKQTHS